MAISGAILHASLTDAGGNEVFTWSAALREGHRTYTEAVQRTILAAERAISGAPIDGDGEDGFAAAFDAYLESLLK